MKKAEELILQLKPEEQENFIKEIGVDKWPSFGQQQFPSVVSMILREVCWQDSVLGANYWSSIYERENRNLSCH